MRRLAFAIPAAMMLAALPAAQAFADDDPFAVRTISVTGNGEASAAPDMMIASIGVDAEGETAAEALKKNAAQMNATIKTLRDAGVAKKDIQTSNLSINPKYDYSNNGSPPRLIGYQASNTVNVKLRDLGKAGGVIDRTVENGANRLNSIYFVFSDDKPLLDEARKDAVADARSKAELYASAAGVKLGKVLQISEGGGASPGPIPVARFKSADAAAEASPVEAGESTISSSISIVYALE